MNRKLRNTILAFSVTGMVLAVGLMAARPVMPDHPAQGALAAAADPADTASPATGAPATIDLATRADAASARIQARSRQYEAALVDARSIEQAIGLTVGFITTVLGENLAARPLEAETGIEEAAADLRDAEPTAARSRPGRSVRSTIAVPYFSFARGTGDRS